jgi:hypothetical protein
MNSGDGLGGARRRLVPLAARWLFGPVLCFMALLVVPPGAAVADSGCSLSVTGALVVVTCVPGSDTWTVPSGLSQVTFDVQGAAGAAASTPGHSGDRGPGGVGGHATATDLPVSANTTYYIDVGTKTSVAAGGLPGGGAGAFGTCGPGCNGANGGGAGGASVVATGSITTDPGNWVLAAGGGGGGAVAGDIGGAGGGTSGGSDMSPIGAPGGSSGGTQTCTNHLDGSDAVAGSGSGGGGGGFCGGSGGGSSGDGGGGGSGYAPDPAHDAFLTASETGNGTVTITYTDTTPPTTTISLSPSSPNGASSWYTSQVGVSISASDPDDQVAQTRCVLDPATVPTSFIDLPNQACSLTTVNTDGQHTIYAASVDSNGNQEAVRSASVKIDSTPPTVDCGSADGQWHASNVSIACTASDAGSGLAVPGDASFSLSTSVPAGTETANASTGTLQACDNAGNCTTAGPIPGNMIDRETPNITLTTPAAGARYSVLGTLLSPVRVRYTCSDGGSGLASCTGTLRNGSTIPTGIFDIGSHTFTVTAVDKVGNRSSVTHTYTVGLL